MNKTSIRLSTLKSVPALADLDVLDQDELEVCDYIIELDPERAMDDISSAFAVWMRERRIEPGALILGVETYWSLSYRESGGRFPLLQPTSWRGTPILIDDQVRWRVRLVSSLDRAEHWRCAVEKKEPRRGP